MQVEVHPRPAVIADQTHPWERVAGSLAYNGHWPVRANMDVCRFRHESPYVRVKRAFTKFGAECFAPGKPVLSCASDLMRTLHRELRYAPGETTVSTPLMEVLEKRHGVCQDFAHLMIACLRSRGLAARYVSGYIRVRPASADPPVAADMTATTLAMMTETQVISAADAQEPLIGGGASTPGSRCIARHSAGSNWIPPITPGWVSSTSPSPGGVISGTCRRCAGIILGGGRHRLSVNVSVEPVIPQTATAD